VAISPDENLLLARLPPEDVERLSREFAPVKLSLNQVLYDQETSVDYVYLPTSGVISLLTHVDRNDVIETAPVGREGLAGLSAILGMSLAAETAICQIPGNALRLRSETLLGEMARNARLRTLLMRYANALFATVAQSAACNRAHGVEERMSRWLLMIHDRTDGDTFPLTQEFLVHMLGVRRPTVSLTATTLQRAGLIRYSRGKMTILDRAKLETASCECYARVDALIQRALAAGEKMPDGP
jgi:CRP-like cAMP-binding protein